MIIDTHCHLDEYNDIDKIIKNMDGIMIFSGVNSKTNEIVLEYITKYNNVYGTLGIHPEEINNYKNEDLDFIEKNINNNKIIGIGEIGLDYYYDNQNKEIQKELFIKQLELAKKYNKSVVIHSRNSIQDTYDILKEFNLKGSIHCFSSSLEMAKKFIKIGYKIGIGGVVTFKNGNKLQEIVKNIDLNDIVLETDSPYLSPEPFRGRQNEPKNVHLVANKIAEIKNIDKLKVIEITTKNAISLFDLNIKK